MSNSDANRTLKGRLTRFLAGVLGGEPNQLARAGRHPDLDSVMKRLSLLGEEEVLLLAESWEREDDEARRRAWDKGLVAIEVFGAQQLLEDVREVVAEWARARSSDFQGIGGLMGSAGASAMVRQAAAPAVLDKAVAILGRDGLDTNDLGVLSRPWDGLAGRD